MRVFVLSDIHISYPQNKKWLSDLSAADYREDVLILAGDLSENLTEFQNAISGLRKKFHTLFFVPGNHDLWIERNEQMDSVSKFYRILEILEGEGIEYKNRQIERIQFIPMMSWYDYSFGPLSDFIRKRWMDFYRCVWPPAMDMKEVNSWFLNMNVIPKPKPGVFSISFSHFMPDPQLLPDRIEPKKYLLNPVLGSYSLMEQISRFSPQVHIYGHSHINVTRQLGPTKFINNAFGYPREAHLTRKMLLEIVPST